MSFKDVVKEAEEFNRKLIRELASEQSITLERIKRGNAIKNSKDILRAKKWLEEIK